ncbi:L,D-transpeptidase family protein [Aestuariibius insulae]|uniref:L,D-transpeptidase family protein n=1 Tax=Aestuariibius insulae TaxID=2058287 RepID=UPI00345E51F0
MLPKPHDLVLTPTSIRFRGRHFPRTIGRSGLSQEKREGDSATPVGTHQIVGCLYRPDRISRPNDWAVPIRPRDAWSDDPDDPDYNLMVEAPHGFSHEALKRADPLYDLILLTDWNWPFAKKGRGSAIFLHRWRRLGFPTEGCIAFRPDHLQWIAARITPSTRLVVP